MAREPRGKRNKYGLARDIPEGVKRLVRQRSRFGCVICRSAIYDYEHIAPRFKDAKIHDPQSICLLCPGCHRQSTEGTLPAHEIARAYEAIANSECVDPSRRVGFFDLFSANPTIMIGGVRFEGPGAIINIDGRDHLSFIPNCEVGGPRFVINAKFKDRDGRELFRIEANHWICGSDLWDVDIVAGRLIIRRRRGDILLDAEKSAGENMLVIRKMDMLVFPFRIVADGDDLHVWRYTSDGRGFIQLTLSRSSCRGNSCGIFCNSREDVVPRVGQLQLVGGKGVHLDGTGIWLCRGCNVALIGGWGVRAEGCGPKAPPPSPPDRRGQPFFVLGSLTSRVREYPQWTEVEYSLDGYELSDKPVTWGRVDVGDGAPRELCYLDPNEGAPLERCSGYMGPWADWFVDKPWADQVFEVTVRNADGTLARVKKADVEGREVVESVDDCGRPLVPSVFGGVSPWRPRVE